MTGRTTSELITLTRKFVGTIRIIANLGMARTFGEYEHSVWSDGFNYARYRWRGQIWFIPTGPVEIDQ